MTKKKPEEIIEGTVIEIVKLEKSLQAEEKELSLDPRFGKFLQRQKEAKQKIDLFWETIKNEMTEHSVKSIKGEWGSVTLTERIIFDIDEKELPEEFFKKMPDTKKIGDTFRLEGEAPKGTEPKHIKYLVRKIK
jgi:predicted metal-dependent hydrolase